MDPHFTEWLKLLAYATFAAVGGFIGSLFRTIDRRQKINWARSVFEGLAASFVGCLIYFMCQALELSDAWTGVIVGLAGWMGANASIRILESAVYKKLGIDKEPETMREREDDITNHDDFH